MLKTAFQMSWGKLGLLVVDIISLFFATPAACRIFQARDGTEATAATQATVVTMPDPEPTEPRGTSQSFFGIVIGNLFVNMGTIGHILAKVIFFSFLSFQENHQYNNCRLCQGKI